MEFRVLVVEDILRMQVLLRELFASLGGGFTVVATAASEAEALLWLDEHPGGWDLAVVDLVLDPGSGINVIARCNADPQGGRIVVFSSYVTPGLRQHCLDLGAEAVFDKSDSAAFTAWCTDLAARENSGP